MRAVFATWAGKLTRVLLVASRRGATALPGLVALTLEPRLLRTLVRGLAHGVVCITGTNGKTTTARMLAAAAREAGWSPVHNRAGSNLDRGIVASLLADASWGGVAQGDAGVFEVDEASVPRVLGDLSPRVLVVTNLFRDQLDRYHEVDALARRLGATIATLPPSTILVLNADDPLVAFLADRHRGTVAFFGIDDPAIGGTERQAISDADRCPRCHAPLSYQRVVLAHEGDWRCGACDFTRPPRDVAATRVALAADSVTLTVAGLAAPLRVPLAGTYNAYNALAALAASRALGIPDTAALRALATVRPAFGRQERLEALGRRMRLLLVKNPAGFDAVVSALLETGQRPRLLAALSDRAADGRDVSWIWDCDVERLAAQAEHVVVTGLRAEDLALRFKYAGLARERMTVVAGWRAATQAALATTPVGGELVILATYTAMQAIRAELAADGHAGRFWED
ncbi:MAG: DUF1727 domain-containing protein [Chloroflexi bacterium]|nr:DUF1727 domain-containing protein [Chloroflexota bacterium]